MKERGFDEAEIIDTPADGVTKYGTWTNPIGWDVKQATLEVIKPKNLPDEFRYLCNYKDNPTSLNLWSCPTPPEGIETELVLMETNNLEELKRLNVKGKIILTSLDPERTGLKGYLRKYGILGIVTDFIENHNQDFINANQWLNTWNDTPGGWVMIKGDSEKFGFSISQKKGSYLRNILRQGKKIIVRAKIDSRLYTDDTLPYVVGSIKGTEIEGEEVLVAGHMFEWGANDNCSGSSAILEAVGTLSELIRSGILPKPKRTKVGTLTLEGIPVKEWQEVNFSPRWWEPTNWAEVSLWWCDGKRDLNQIKELIELEAGKPVENFDLIKYYKFLEKYKMVEFVK